MRNDAAQLQLLEAILVAVFIFVAIAIVAVFRLPTNPGAFEAAELQKLGIDALQVQQAKVPVSSDDCNESPCPFATNLDRLLSLALGYQGPTAGSGEETNDTELQSYFNEALPAGSGWQLVFSNGYNHTVVSPRNATPPAVNVVTARVLVEPNWTVQWAGLNNTTVVRIGEKAGLGSLNAIFDALNRSRAEFGGDWTSLMSDRIPNNATYGTYLACPTAASRTLAGGCRAFTVVPPGLFGEGNPILPGEREPSGALQSAGTWASLLMYNDTDLSSVTFAPTDPLYLDVDADGADDNKISAGDVRLSYVQPCRSGAACLPGSWVRSGDSDAGKLLRAMEVTTLSLEDTVATNNLVDEGENVYIDVNGNNGVSVNDVQMTRVGRYPLGYRVPAAGGAVVNFTSAAVNWTDLDGNGALNEGDPVYLNLQGLGQTASLETFDVHLTRANQPPLRYLYDVKLELWYGA